MTVYFFQGTQTKNIKIGMVGGECLDSVLRRLNEIISSDLLICIGVLRRGNEKKLHLKFRHLWLQGEWFSPGKDLLDYIASLPHTEITGRVQNIRGVGKLTMDEKFRLANTVEKAQTEWASQASQELKVVSYA